MYNTDKYYIEKFESLQSGQLIDIDEEETISF